MQKKVKNDGEQKEGNVTNGKHHIHADIYKSCKIRVQKVSTCRAPSSVVSNAKFFQDIIWYWMMMGVLHFGMIGKGA